MKPIDRSEKIVTPRGVMVWRLVEGPTWRRVPAHRAAMEQHLGRPLGRLERIRFRDGDKLNCAIENLELVPVGSKRAALLAEREAERLASADQYAAEVAARQAARLAQMRDMIDALRKPEGD